MKIWLITDTHFGHDKMKEYCGRPDKFEKLIFKGLDVVEPKDVLIHLGDFCIGNDEAWHIAFNEEVEGKHWLIKGNHDHKSNSWYLSNGWDFVADFFLDKYFGKNILFSHIPKKYNGEFDLNIHGHFHNNLHRLLEGRFVVEGEKERNKIDLSNLTSRHKLLSIEETNYQPVLLETFLNK